MSPGSLRHNVRSCNGCPAKVFGFVPAGIPPARPCFGFGGFRAPNRKPDSNWNGWLA
jgi:hypothetical protein